MSSNIEIDKDLLSIVAMSGASVLQVVARLVARLIMLFGVTVEVATRTLLGYLRWLLGCY